MHSGGVHLIHYFLKTTHSIVNTTQIDADTHMHIGAQRYTHTHRYTHMRAYTHTKTYTHEHMLN